MEHTDEIKESSDAISTTEVPSDEHLMNVVKIVMAGQKVPDHWRVLDPNVSFTEFESLLIQAINEEEQREVTAAIASGRDQLVRIDYDKMRIFFVMNAHKVYDAIRPKTQGMVARFFSRVRDVLSQ